MSKAVLGKVKRKAKQLAVDFSKQRKAAGKTKYFSIDRKNLMPSLVE